MAMHVISVVQKRIADKTIHTETHLAARDAEKYL